MGIVRPQMRNLLPHVLPLIFQGRRGLERFRQAMLAKPIGQASMASLIEAARHQKPFTVIYPFVLPDDALRRLTMPVLVVVGATDFWCNPAAVIARVRRLMPRVLIEQLAECDHLLLSDQPESTMHALQTFLKAEKSNV